MALALRFARHVENGRLGGGSAAAIGAVEAHHFRVMRRGFVIGDRAVEHGGKQVAAGGIDRESGQPLFTRAGEISCRVEIEQPRGVVADSAVAGDHLDRAVELGDIAQHVGGSRAGIRHKRDIDGHLKVLRQHLHLIVRLINDPSGRTGNRVGETRCAEIAHRESAPLGSRLAAGIAETHTKLIVGAVAQRDAAEMTGLENAIRQVRLEFFHATDVRGDPHALRRANSPDFPVAADVGVARIWIAEGGDFHAHVLGVDELALGPWLDDERRARRTISSQWRGQAGAGNDLAGLARWSPSKARKRAAAVFVKFHFEVIPLSADQRDSRTARWSGTLIHPLVDHENSADTQARSVIGGGGENVIARSGGLDAAGPADVEIVRTDARHRTALCPIEVDRGILTNDRNPAEIP